MDHQISKISRVVRCVVIVLILFLGLVLRYSVTDFSRPIADASDSSCYHFAAKNLLAYHTLTNDRMGAMSRGEVPVVPTDNLLPGFPVLLSIAYLVSDATTFIFSVQLACSMGILMLINSCMRRIRIRFALRALVLAFAAMYPAFCYNLDFILTENVFTFMLLAAVRLFLPVLMNEPYRFIQLIIADILLLCAAMTRAQAWIIVVLEAVFVMLYVKNRKQRLKVLTVLIGVSVLFISAWVLRNYLLFGDWFFIHGDTGAKIWGAQPYFLDMGSTNGRALEAIREANQAASPSTYWKWRLFGSVQYMWNDLWDENLVHPGKGLYFFRLLHPFVVVPTVAAIPFSIRKGRPVLLFLASIPIVMTIMSMVYHGLPRYLYPSIPFVFVLCAVMLDMWIPKRETERTPEYESVAPCALRDDRVFRVALLVLTSFFSVWLTFSVYLFPLQNAKEVSNYRLTRAYGITVSALQDIHPVSCKEITDTDLWTVDNVTISAANKYQASWDATPILHCPSITTLGTEEAVVTEVAMDIPGGFLFDFYTVYWTNSEVPEYSENAVYGRIPRNCFCGKQTVYIDGDVSSLLIVPVGYRGGSFTVNSIQISKYLIPHPTE